MSGAWDPAFASRAALFEPIAQYARAFEACTSFPPPEAIDEILASRAGVRFVRQAPRPRRRRAPVDPSQMYDARIVGEGEVPTRDGSWHDLLNALVWAAFPRAKRALHERQHRLVLAASATQLGQGSARSRGGEAERAGRRTREGDCLALWDEGGVLVETAEARSVTADGRARAVVFGHAIYESAVLGRLPIFGSSLELDGPGGPGVALRDETDAWLASVLADGRRLLHPTELGRVRVPPEEAGG